IYVVASSCNFAFIRRYELKRTCSLDHVLSIDNGDRGNVRVSRWTNHNVCSHGNTTIVEMSQSSKSREPKYYNEFDDPQAEHLAWLMDSSIGIGRYSIGLDAIIGLIPGLGDVLTSLIGYWIVLRAMQAGVHRAAVMRMVLNLGIDALVGIVPVFGDMFDMAFKANMKNVKIYREALSGTRAPLKDWGFNVLV